MSETPPSTAVSETDEPDPRAVAAERMTFFADAVIAIAITLLALELPVPVDDAKITSNADLWHALGHGRQEYIAFLISFYVIGNHWVGHHRMFRYVTRLGNGMTGLTMFWLLTIVVTPFATRVLSSGDGGFQLRFGIYAGIQAASGLLFLALVRLVQVQGVYRADMPAERFSNAYWGAGAAAAGFLVSIPVSFVSEQAYDLWIITPIVTALIHRRLAKRRAARLSAPGSSGPVAPGSARR